MKDFMFTSESVTEGHPDKICDQISDAIVDHLLAQDPYSRVRAEAAISSAIVFIAARFRSKGNIDFTRLARKMIRNLGYNQPDFNERICSILTSPQALPLDESSRFDENALSDKEMDRITAKNQVTVFGYACDHTEAFMPLPLTLAHRLSFQLGQVRKKQTLTYLEPDGKIQVGVFFKARRPQKIHSITITADQRNPDTPDLKTLEADMLQHVIHPVFEFETIRPEKDTRIAINPDGPFQGGPTHHSGLTGRKNAIDTYGEFSRHSGKALSGKDPLRIDRIGAYAARHAAKNVVAAGLAAECEVMLTYSLGFARPVSIVIQTFGTAKIPEETITKLVQSHFDFRPAGILKRFQLRRLPAQHPLGFYQRVAVYGHFGRTDLDLPWEKTDMVDRLNG